MECAGRELVREFELLIDAVVSLSIMRTSFSAAAVFDAASALGGGRRKSCGARGVAGVFSGCGPKKVLQMLDSVCLAGHNFASLLQRIAAVL